MIYFFWSAATAAAHTWFSAAYFSFDSLRDVLGPPGSHFFDLWVSHAGRAGMAVVFFISLFGWGKKGEALYKRAAWGLLLWAMTGFFLAAAGLSRPSVLKIISLLLAAAGLARARKILTWPLRLEFRSPLYWGMAVFTALYLATAAVPETFYDALVYHLAVPHRYILEGRMVDFPDIHLARIPGLIQPLYMWGLVWSDDRLCKLMNLGIGLLWAGALADWTGRRFSPSAGRWAALLFLSSPLIGVNLWSCTNDILCGFLAFLAARETSEGKNANDYLTAGVFFGAALAAKQTAIFAFPWVLWGFAPFSFEAKKKLGFFSLGVFLLLAPWWIRNFHWTGNPFFPELTSVFGGDRPENLALIAAWKDDVRGSWGILSRVASFFRSGVDGVKEGRFGFLGPTLLMMLPLLWRERKDRDLMSLAGVSVVGYAVFSVLSGRLRYFVPALGPLFIVAGALTERAPRKRMTKTILGAACALNGVWLLLVFLQFNQGGDVLWGRESASDYLRTEHMGTYGNPSQGAFDFIREEASRGKILLVGDARTFRSPSPADASGAFNVPVYARWNVDNFIKGLRENQYKYVLLNIPEWRRITPSEYAGGAAGDLEKKLRKLDPPIFQDDWTVVYRAP